MFMSTVCSSYVVSCLLLCLHFLCYKSFLKEWDCFTIIRINELCCVPPKKFSNMVLLPSHTIATHRGKGKCEELVRRRVRQSS